MNELDEYLRTNRAAFTREALTRRLVEEGHDPAEVEAAWARIQAEDPGPVASISASPRRPGVGTYLLMIAVVVGFGYVGAFGVFGLMFMAYYPSSNASASNAIGAILIAAYVIAMVVGLGYSLRRLYRAPSLAASGASVGGAFAIAVVVLIGINGACIAGTVASASIGAFR